MLIRRSAAGLALMVCLVGCANQTTSSSSPSSPSSLPPSPAAPSSAAPTAEPSAARPTAIGAETITGTVEAGVEPNCLLVQDSKGSHLLIFGDAAMRADATVGKKVTLTGRSEPGQMSTCQQGIPFIVTSVTPA